MISLLNIIIQKISTAALKDGLEIERILFQHHEVNLSKNIFFINFHRIKTVVDDMLEPRSISRFFL